MMYGGQFVERLILYHLVIAENLKIYRAEYVDESFNMGLFMLILILKNLTITTYLK